MIKKDKRVDAKGKTRTQVRVVEGYRPGPGMGTKQRTIKDFGCLEDQADPDAFMQSVEKFNETYKERKMPLRIEATSTAMMYSEENRRYNYGYKFFEATYKALGIDEFIARYTAQKKEKETYSLADIVKLLVMQRLLSYDSKRSSFHMKHRLYGLNTDFTLHEVYQALDQFADFEADLQCYLNEKVKEVFGRNLSYAFYDVTHHFFEIDFSDEEDDLYSRKDVKERLIEPTVTIGLFVDSNGIPVHMSVFPGDTNDLQTFPLAMEEIKASYDTDRIITIAEKGMNNSKTIDSIINAGDGFVFAQPLKGKMGQRYERKLFEEEDWVSSEGGSYRFKVFEEDYQGKDADGKPVIRRRKVFMYWSKAQAEATKRKREAKLEKAALAVKNHKSAPVKGVEEYIKECIVDKESGELIENTVKKRTVNLEKARKDGLYDGYFCIITSELEYDEQKMRRVYSGLWKIERLFQLLRSDLYAGPMFTKNHKHTRAHFIICFVAILILRLMQRKMGEKAVPGKRIARALRAATCNVLRGGIVHLDDVGGVVAFNTKTDWTGGNSGVFEYTNEDEIASDFKIIKEAFGMHSSHIYHRQESFNKLLKRITLA